MQNGERLKGISIIVLEFNRKHDMLRKFYTSGVGYESTKILAERINSVLI